MKNKVKLLYPIVVVLFVFSGCAVHSGYMNSSASLSQANFSYVNTNISGTATTLKLFGFGGLGKQAIVAEAKENMLMDYRLKPNQTLANITVNWKTGFYFFAITNSCTVTADVVEFEVRGDGSNDNFSELSNEEQTVNPTINTSKDGLSVGDNVIYKDGFRNINGVIAKIDDEFYYVKYRNRKGIQKIIKANERSWIKKVQ
ncbi:DUF6567 family protein [Geofilum sp. OHC36d9]|uniref:DUF6567 family protein n=1 Tax=Geofilum sp. OHC36d9 TaxID=3458413 RepID=UPI004033DC7C